MPRCSRKRLLSFKCLGTSSYTDSRIKKVYKCYVEAKDFSLLKDFT